jgi:hypothetical protein
MTDEPSLPVRIGARADPTDDSSWGEVLDRAQELRARRRPRLTTAIAAILALAVVVAAPAVGLRGKLVHVFADSDSAPQRIEKSFAQWNDGGAPDLGSAVQADRAIKILEARAGADTSAILWLAPLRRGGFCTLLDVNGHGGGGGCDRVGDDRLNVEVSLHGVSSNGGILSGPVLLDGSVRSPEADSLVLRFEDGTSATIPLVWVSAPVDNGFFVYAVPKPHWRKGHLPTTLALVSANGDELDRRQIHGVSTPGSPGYPEGQR